MKDFFSLFNVVQCYELLEKSDMFRLKFSVSRLLDGYVNALFFQEKAKITILKPVLFLCRSFQKVAKKGI